MNPKNKNAGEIVIEIKIPEVTNTQQAREVIKQLLEPVDMRRAEDLADQYGICAYMGEYGDGGKTYYPKGTNAEDNYITYPVERDGVEIDEDGNIKEGIWVSSSEMC